MSRSSVESTGNTKTNQRVSLCIEGMHCAGCVGRVESALREVEGVSDAVVSLVDGVARIKGTGLDSKRLIDEVTKRGFPAIQVKDRASVADQRTAIEKRQHESAKKWGQRVIVGFGAWVPMAIIHWAGHLIGLGEVHQVTNPWFWVLALLGLIVLIFVGGGFYASAYRAARGGGTNMDTLVSIGATAAFGFSIVVLLMKTLVHFGVVDGPVVYPLYFGEAAGLLAIISLGHYLEARTSAVAGSAVRDLLALQPDEVTRLTSASDQTGTVVPSAEINPDDLMLIRPGERIAVDGTIVDGASTFDESGVTGESMPVERGLEEPVTAGSMNLTGRLIIQATTDGRNTTVARIAEMVRNAQASKANIQRLADRVCAFFVPAVLTVAVITFLGWILFGSGVGEAGRWVSALVNATTVLVISCPCALGLATPTAVMVGSGAASRRGILVKTATALERAASIDCVMFDKTGTLTVGQPRVIFASDDQTLKQAARLAASSNHPLAQAIVQEAEQRGLINENQPGAEEVTETAGRGLRGVVNGEVIEVLALRKDDTNRQSDPNVEQATTSVVICDGRELGVIRFRDEIRDDAPAVIRTLQDDGLEPIILTGDRKAVAHAIAKQIGIDAEDVRAELSPEDKVKAVHTEWEQGYCVAMVGDGINDAAALAQAGADGGLGVAMGTGTNIAIESADVVIPSDRLAALHDLVQISRLSLRTIKQNLFLSFVYNVTMIPAAALGFFGLHGPLIAAAAMGLSDLSVIGNAIRLKVRLRQK